MAMSELTLTERLHAAQSPCWTTEMLEAKKQKASEFERMMAEKREERRMQRAQEREQLDKTNHYGNDLYCIQEAFREYERDESTVRGNAERDAIECGEYENKPFVAVLRMWIQRRKRGAMTALATQVGVSDSVVYDWRKGRRIPSEGKLVKIADVMEIPLETLRESVEYQRARKITG